MGSSKFEFETYKTKKFKTNKLGEREYTVGCVPYKTSPLVCHHEDAVRKEHNVFVLVRQQIGRRQLLEICPRGNNKLVIIIFPCS